MATSRMALPIMVIYSMVLWLGYLVAEPTLLPSLIIFGISTYLMIELNNRNTLMRQYSRMVSCSFIGAMMMCPWILQNIQIMIVQLCLIIAYSLLFMTYQKRYDMGRKFWAYMFIGIGSLVWPPFLYIVPLLWIAEAFYLMSFSFKALWASIFGLLTPIWVSIPVLFYTNTYLSEFERIKEAFTPNNSLIAALHDNSLLFTNNIQIDTTEIIVASFIFIVLIIGIIHYLQSSYADKIQVRMLYSLFIMVTIVLLLALIVVLLLPFNYYPSANMLFALLLIGFAPLTAHYITFSSSKLSNICVIVIMIISFIIATSQVAFRFIDPAIIQAITNK